MKPLISVLIPMYNAGIGIEKTLTSIAAQTFQDFEVIIINDGSTDASVAIARETYPDVHIIHQSNSGISTALNNGLKACRGDFIARIDCNDIAYPKRFELQVQALSNNSSLGVVSGHIMLYDKNGKDLGVCKFPTTTEDTLKELLLGNSSISHTGAMIRKSVLELVGGYDPFYNGREDFELWCRVSLVSSITNVDSLIMRVLSIEDGLSYSGVYLYPLMELALIERLERLNKGIEWKNVLLREQYVKRIGELKKIEITDKGVKRQNAIFYAKRAGFFLRSGNRSSALREYIKSTNSDQAYIKSWIGIASSIIIPTYFHLKLVRLFKKLSMKAYQKEQWNSIRPL